MPNALCSTSRNAGIIGSVYVHEQYQTRRIICFQNLAQDLGFCNRDLIAESL